MVGVAGEGVEDFDVGVHFKFVAEDAHSFMPLSQLPTQGVLSAVADEEQDVALVFDVVAQMVQNATRLGHAGGGDDDGGPLDLVEALGFIHAAHELQALEAEGVVAHENGVAHSGFEVVDVQAEDFRGFYGQRAVHKSRDGRKALLMPQMIQREKKLLRALHGKGGDDEFPALLQDATDDLAQVLLGIGGEFMMPPAIGALHDDVVDVLAGLGIEQEVIVWAANVAGEEQA